MASSQADTQYCVGTLGVMALLISSSIICTTDMKPKILGIPALGVLGYFGALVILMYLFVKHFMKK